MKTLNLKIESKNQFSIKKFLRFFKKSNNKHFKTIQKKFYKKEKRVFFSILKSPHVNKSAQEQFEIKTNSSQINIQTPQQFKFLVILKKMKMNIFPDINIKLRLFFNKKNRNVLKQKCFNIDNFTIEQFLKAKNTIINKRRGNFYNTKNVISLVDVYGV
jgi:ribosomal protein S10